MKFYCVIALITSLLSLQIACRRILKCANGSGLVLAAGGVFKIDKAGCLGPEPIKLFGAGRLGDAACIIAPEMRNSASRCTSNIEDGARCGHLH